MNTDTNSGAAGEAADEKDVWWREYELGGGETRWWTLGSLLLGVERKPREWRIGYEHFPDSGAILPVSDRSVDEMKSATRFIFSKPGDAIRLVPALADRPVVTRPVSPLYLPAGEDALMFVSSQAWVRVEAVSIDKVLLDIPSVRPSDTWFGPSMQTGELCYASRTHARLSLEDLPQQPFRAVTPLEIVNEAESDLMLERISLPVPNLTLYATGAGALWTQKVSLRCGRDLRHASVRIGERPRDLVDDLVEMAGPRKVHEERVLVRAFSSIFG